MIENESWYKQIWRPAISIVYMIIVLCDFVIFPIFFTMIQPNTTNLIEYLLKFNDASIQVALLNTFSRIEHYSPYTTRDGGIFHAAMGAILGFSAYTRGQEKIARVRKDIERIDSPE